MAYINQYYLFLDEDGEKMSRSVSISDHPVEDGTVLTDHVKQEPLEISLSGKLVGTDAETVKTALELLQKQGCYVKYIGKEILSNAVIESFQTSRTVDLSGGIQFTMNIREIRIAKSAYRDAAAGKTVKSGLQQIQKDAHTVYHTIHSGDTLYSLAMLYYGTDSKYADLYAANSDSIEQAARESGHVSSNGGRILIPGVQIQIP